MISTGAPDVGAVMLEILREVLEKSEVALDDDLFDLGLDSLTIAMTAARVKQRFGAELPLAVYFDAETVADVVSAVEAARP